MPAFDFPTLLWWGLPLVGVPLLIHLINLLRHKRVPFAAVEFLLASQRKYRTRVLLRQWLLLALRTAAVLGLVLALAQPRWRSVLGSLLGGSGALHLIVLDDSASMRERTEGGVIGSTTAYGRGRDAVVRIVADLATTAPPPEVAMTRVTSLVRDDAGEARGAAGDAGDETLGFDLPRQVPTSATAGRLAEALDRRSPSYRSTSPGEALEALLPLISANPGVERVVWLVSDFRTHDWRPTGSAAVAARRLVEAGASLHLIDCAAEGAAGNLSVDRLEVVGGVPAAGVLVPLEVSVRNDGVRTVQDVAVLVREDGVARPGVRIAEIAAGATADARFDVRFPAAGSHVVEVELPADALDADNAQAAVVDVTERAAVLLIDGDTRGDGRSGDAFYVATALAPGAGAATGVQPRVEPSRALATLDLAAFDSIWILDVPRLDPTEIAALEAFADAGGGVVFFTGPRTQAEAVNRLWHRGGEGLFPVALAGPVELPQKPDSDPVPDIVVEDHPVVAVLSGRRNPLLDAVRIDRVMAAAPLPSAADTQPMAETQPAAVRRLLSLRTGAPLIVEKAFGRGTVAAVLSTAAPVWNNWARGNPSWVVVLLELESHLARGKRRGERWTVGDTVTVRLEQGAGGMEVDVVMPPDGQVVRQVASGSQSGAPQVRLASTEAPGAYLVRWLALDGVDRERAIAVNVDPKEGRLERAGRQGLAETLRGVPFTYEPAGALDADTPSGGGSSLVRPLLLALVAVLLGEQLLAWLAGYHPVASRRARRPFPAT